VIGLAAGRTNAPEPEPVGPVDEAHYRAALPFVRPQVRALLELLAVTGMRPGEACRIRPCDIDTSAAVWVYRPPHHKTKWRGKDRAVPLGSKARAILKEFTPSDPTDFYFSPARATADQLAERTARRKTPRYPSHMKRNAAKRKTAPERKPGRCYCTHGIEVAVARACDEAFPPPGDLARREGESREAWEKQLNAEQRERLREWRREHRWHPNQIRHLFATTVSRLYDLEAARVLLGHSSADVTLIYAERNLAFAAQVAAEIG
jgi:integrase